MSCSKCKTAKFYAGLRLEGNIIIQLPKCQVCGGYIQP